jgi:SAM-dependent methyltransferase
LPSLAGWVAHARQDDAAMPAFEPKRILIVGCGSGAAFSALAAYPEAEILGVDEDPAIIAVAEGITRDANLSSISFLPIDLDESTSALGSFDWIYCADLIRPFGDEAAAWRSLAKCLAPHGYLVAAVRNRRRQHADDEIRDVVGILARAAPPADVPDWVKLGRRLAHDLGRSGSPLKPVARIIEAHLRESPPDIAAHALLPTGHPHTLDTLNALLAQAGLSLYGFLNEDLWSLDAFAADPEIQSLVEGLTREERYELGDLLFAPEYSIVCGHPPAPAGRRP